MSWVYPVPDHVRVAVEQPRHVELMRAIAKPNTSWQRQPRQEPRA